MVAMDVDKSAVRVALITSHVGSLLCLSRAAKVQRTRLSLIVNGHVEPRDDERHRIANALGVDVEQLFPSETDRCRVGLRSGEREQL